jgi:hypothetical protein
MTLRAFDERNARRSYGDVAVSEPGAGTQLDHAPLPARWIHRIPSSTRPSRMREQPRKPWERRSSGSAFTARA